MFATRHQRAALPVSASTTMVPVMCGCSEQKYWYTPGVVNVNAYLSSVSSALDLNVRVLDATVCGMSSSLIQVTAVPAFTVTRSGTKAKLSILTSTAAARAGSAAATRENAAAMAAARIACVVAAVIS